MHSSYNRRMIVYVEWVLLDNFCLDFLLGYLTLRIIGNKVKFFGVFLSAALGCLFALLSPMITKYVLLFKVAVLFLSTVFLSFGKSLRGYLVLTLVYAVLSFALSGALTFFLEGKLSYSFVGVKRGGVIAVISGGAFFFLYSVRQAIGLMKEKKRRSKYAVAELVSGARSVKLNALFDSGNLLTDSEGNGIVVSDERAIRALGELASIGEMEIHSAGGSKVLKLVKIPLIKIYSEGKENTLNNVTVALSDLPEEYAVILPV